jgi:hypothetical protein
MVHHVSLNVINGVRISTVLLWKVRPDAPDLYETCVFEGEDSNVLGHYDTEGEAIAGHNRILAEYQNLVNS